jgi:hypothetical protein
MVEFIKNTANLINNTTLDEWKNMEYDTFYDDIVSPLNMMQPNVLKKVITSLHNPQFDMLTKKCWEEQDRQPNSVTGPNNEQELIDKYDETVPILILLENILSIRIELENDQYKKTEMAKQLAMLNIILSPHLLESIADRMNDQPKL